MAQLLGEGKRPSLNHGSKQSSHSILTFAGTPKKPDKAQEQWTKNEWLSKATKGCRKKDWDSTFLSFSLITFCLSGGMITSHLGGKRKEVLPFPAALYLSTSDDSQTPQQRKILSSWDNMLLVLLSTALIPVLEDLSHSLTCSMPLGGRHSLGSLRLKHKVYF